MNLIVFLLMSGCFAGAASTPKAAQRKIASHQQEVFHNTATVKIKDDQIERYFNAAKDANVIKLTRREPGNLGYRVFQMADRPHLVIFNEVWKSKEALDQHLGASHMVQFFTSINFDLSKYDIDSKTQPGKVIFTPKQGFTDFVIAELVLDGSNAIEYK